MKLFSISDLILKHTINNYLIKLNRKMLTDTYIQYSRKNPKTHIDNIYISCCIKEFKRRGLAI